MAEGPDNRDAEARAAAAMAAQPVDVETERREQRQQWARQAAAARSFDLGLACLVDGVAAQVGRTPR